MVLDLLMLYALYVLCGELLRLSWAAFRLFIGERECFDSLVVYTTIRGGVYESGFVQSLLKEDSEFDDSNLNEGFTI